jgi:uncharacterized membrane protein
VKYQRCIELARWSCAVADFGISSTEFSDSAAIMLAYHVSSRSTNRMVTAVGYITTGVKINIEWKIFLHNQLHRDRFVPIFGDEWYRKTHVSSATRSNSRSLCKKKNNNNKINQKLLIKECRRKLSVSVH